MFLRDVLQNRFPEFGSPFLFEREHSIHSIYRSEYYYNLLSCRPKLHSSTWIYSSKVNSGSVGARQFAPYRSDSLRLQTEPRFQWGVPKIVTRPKTHISSPQKSTKFSEFVRFVSGDGFSCTDSNPPTTMLEPRRAKFQSPYCDWVKRKCSGHIIGRDPSWGGTGTSSSPSFFWPPVFSAI